MYLSINWLREFIAEEIPVSDIAYRLTMAGIEVEEIIHIGAEWNNIIIGEILQITRHPNADKLSLTKVKAGEHVYSVVCGAQNIKEGQKIPLALEGAQFPNGMTIKKSKIRGEFSEGMICSETELSLGSDTSGIMVLPSAAQTGIPLKEYLGLADTILNLSITPNRSDCLSVIGLAREIAAVFNVPLRMPEISVHEAGDAIEKSISVEILNPDLCPRYTARLVTDVTIKPSPLWMQRRLINCGIRAINNIVDITNYVLLEWGQPLHAFDLQHVSDRKIIVRTAEKGEKFITLDAIERLLPDASLVIADGRRPVALGGIMGGQNTGVTPGTTSVLIESAYFIPASIAQTSRSLSLKTEASQRFEKGVDIQGILPSLHRAASLMAQLAGGTIAKGFIDAFPKALPEAKPLRLNVSKINKITGLTLSTQETKAILQRLNINVIDEGNDVISCRPPGYRYDISDPIDLIEEIARIKGYAEVPLTYPKAILAPHAVNKSLSVSSSIKNIMISRGFNEVINYSFFSPDILKCLNLPASDPRSTPLNILNPLASSQSVLRSTILPSLLVNLQENLNNKTTTVKIFELSKIFLPSAHDKLPVESKKVSGLLYGPRYGEGWNLPPDSSDFYDIKGTVETLLDGIRMPDYRFENDAREPYLHPNKMLSLFINDACIGSLGELHPDVLEKFDIQGSVTIFDLDFDLLSNYALQDITFKPFSRQPAIHRDIALVVDENIPADKIYAAIKAFNNRLIADITVFDSFRGGSLPGNKKSLAYRIKFQSPDRTLTDSEVNKLHDKLLSFILKETGAELRQ
ncbi:MAG: phenylalanine--tRNA ligase subunit beta [Pseudomonadota bacterium]